MTANGTNRPKKKRISTSEDQWKVNQQLGARGRRPEVRNRSLIAGNLPTDTLDSYRVTLWGDNIVRLGGRVC